MKIVIAGGSGLLGSELIPSLRADGHHVAQLVRREAKSPEEICWDPKTVNLAPAALAGTDAVINLAGAGVEAKRWSDAYKREIRTSRVHTTTFLAKSLAGLDEKPQVFISGSAVGIYGNRGDAAVDELSHPGEGFLADVCQEWEAAAHPAADAGIRTALIRTGYVLTSKGGFLGKQLLPAKLGLGGPMGGGTQYQSWIHIEDWIAGVKQVLTHDISGPVNLTAPHPAMQKDFAKSLGKQLHRPAFMPLPGAALKLVLGGFAVEVLEGAKVLPKVLTESGFTFSHPQLDEALADVLS